MVRGYRSRYIAVGRGESNCPLRLKRSIKFNAPRVRRLLSDNCFQETQANPENRHSRPLIPWECLALLGWRHGLTAIRNQSNRSSDWRDFEQRAAELLIDSPLPPPFAARMVPRACREASNYSEVRLAGKTPARSWPFDSAGQAGYQCWRITLFESNGVPSLSRGMLAYFAPFEPPTKERFEGKPGHQ